MRGKSTPTQSARRRHRRAGRDPLLREVVRMGLDGAQANVLSSRGDWHPEAAVVHLDLGRTRRRAVIADASVDDDPRCRSCDAACCRSFASLPVTWAEYERLHALGAQRLEISLRGAHRLVVDGACEFLVFGRCSIYPERPEICRRFICVEP